jgi:hypothetical protein
MGKRRFSSGGNLALETQPTWRRVLQSANRVSVICRSVIIELIGPQLITDSLFTDYFTAPPVLRSRRTIRFPAFI